MVIFNISIVLIFQKPKFNIHYENIEYEAAIVKKLN